MIEPLKVYCHVISLTPLPTVEVTSIPYKRDVVAIAPVGEDGYRSYVELCLAAAELYLELHEVDYVACTFSSAANGIYSFVVEERLPIKPQQPQRSRWNRLISDPNFIDWVTAIIVIILFFAALHFLPEEKTSWGDQERLYDQSRKRFASTSDWWHGSN